MESFGIRKGLWETQEIIRRDTEERTNRLKILKTGFISVSLQIRDLPLGHAKLLPQLRLIQFLFLPEEPQLFAECHVHSHHRE